MYILFGRFHESHLQKVPPSKFSKDRGKKKTNWFNKFFFKKHNLIPLTGRTACPLLIQYVFYDSLRSVHFFSEFFFFMPLVCPGDARVLLIIFLNLNVYISATIMICRLFAFIRS